MTSLSSLNRAALGGRESYIWIHWLALIYCVVIGGFSVVAWAEAGEPFRAAICAGAQVLAVVLAILARRAFTGQMGVAGVASVLGALGFASWAAEGLGHAWATNGAQIEQWQLWFLTASEPAIFLLAEHIREGREALRAAHERDEAEQAEELRRVRRREEERERREHGIGRAVSDGLKLVGGTAMAMSAPGAHAQTQAPIVSTNPGYASAQEHALALWRANKALTQEQIAAQVGSKRTTVGRWIRAEQTRTDQSAA